MLKLDDFFHLPQLDPLVEQLVALGSPAGGLIVVAGLDPHPLADPLAAHDGFLPSGRSTIFHILMRQILETQPSARAIVVTTDETAFRISRRQKRQIKLQPVQPPRTYASCITDVVRRQQPDLLVIDRLCAESVPAALEAAQGGQRVLSQLDTVFRGAGVAHHLLDLGASREQLRGLAWVVAVSRLRMLCPRCKSPLSPPLAHLAELRRRHPTLKPALENATFFQAAGCSHCQHSGRHGDVAVFDVFCAPPEALALFAQPSLLPLQTYILGLAALGHLSLDDVTRYDADQLRRTYRLLNASERALSDANAALQRKVAELEAANRVLQARTEALISLEDIGQALITSARLDELGARVCRHARNMCDADRAILYFLRPDTTAEILAVNGWDAALVHQKLDATRVFLPQEGSEPTPYAQWPPGVPPRHADVEGLKLRAGLRVPLVAQGDRVGLMIVHTMRRASFAPGTVALLQTFANQAALAIQRAGLIDALREKIAQLQAAQEELVKKERLEREMELARQVQQSVLPRVFPAVTGYAFAARNEPARQVGGDFYDVFPLEAGRFGLVVADVSDKGMPAALYMALTRSLLLAEARREPSPRAVLNNVHRLLRELGEQDMFVTVFYGVVEGPSRRLTYARAGHDRPLLLRNKGEEARFLGGQGTFLGFPDLDELNLTQEQITLAPGDRLVLYTDGLSDALASDERPFGLKRLTALLQSHAHLAPVELCAATFAALAAYQGEAGQYDDMTMLVVEVE
jgi:serine phosphatase RsbU (regulator of sigma subunit)